MNHLETGLQTADVNASAAIPAPAGASANKGLVYNGSSWVAATLVNANIDAAAAIAYSKLQLAGSIVNNDIASGANIAKSKLAALAIADGDVAAGAAIALSKLADPGSGNVVTSVGSGAIAAKPPGYEIGYAQITANVNIVSTTEATGTTIISPGALTFDGAPVLVEFYGIIVTDSNAVGDFVEVSLFEGATQISRLAILKVLVAGVTMVQTVKGSLRFTPTAGSHTYTVTGVAASTTGTPAVAAGSGGASGNAPAYIRFAKV